MIITKLKDLDSILKYLDKSKEILIVGCAACATKCQTGGEPQVLEFKKELIAKKYLVKDYIILDTPCDSRIIKKDLMPLVKDKDIQLIIFACGSGYQTIGEVIDKKLISALNTVFIGSTKRIGESLEFCSACGDCRLMEYNGICAVTRCPKSMVNGPCGGVVNGKCEINNDNYCVWYLIYKKTNSIGNYKEPKKFNKKLDK